MENSEIITTQTFVLIYMCIQISPTPWVKLVLQ